MGLLSKMFGGGTDLKVKLNNREVPASGTIVGSVDLKGGKKDLHLNSLTAKLIAMTVREVEGSDAPDFDVDVVCEEELSRHVALGAQQVILYTLTLPVPASAVPTDGATTYQLVVAADIPKVKDPTVKEEITILEEAAYQDQTLEEIQVRWPGLESDDEDELVEALEDLYFAAHDERKALLAVEPRLAAWMFNRQGQVRKAALESWAHLLDGQARPEHAEKLGRLSEMDLDCEMTDTLIEAAAKLAEEGALPLILSYSTHPDPEIRAQVATQLYLATGDTRTPEMLEVLTRLSRDPDEGVRAGAFGAFAKYTDDQAVMQMVATELDADPSPRVQAACIGALALAHNYGMAELCLAAYQRQLDNPHAEVRTRLAESMQWQPLEESARVFDLVERLLTDDDEEVRGRMAFELYNCRKFEELGSLSRKISEQDGSEEVRSQALSSLGAYLPTAELMAYYESRLQADSSDWIGFAVKSGLRDHLEDPAARALHDRLD